MCVGLAITVTLWIFGAQIGVSAALAAMIGLSILMCLGVLTWNDALEQRAPGTRCCGSPSSSPCPGS